MRRPRLHAPTPNLRPLWALLVLLASAHALADGWLLDGIDDVPEPQPALVADLHRAADAARGDAGLSPTTWDDGLARAARQHAAELAERGVLDHASPTPGRERLADRLARAGSPYTTHAENLALVPARFDPVTATVDGWLDSPPHRANLLGPDFDRVGFGSATDADGAVYVVQVLAAAPWLPDDGSAELTQATSSRVTLGLRVDRPLTAVIEIDGRQERADLSAGAQSLPIEVEGTGPWRVRIGVRSSEDGTFTLDEAGTVAVTGRWRPDGAPRRSLRIRATETARQTDTLVRVSFAVPGAPAGLALLVDGVHRPAASQGSGRLELDLTLADGEAVHLALAEPAGSERLRVRHGVTLARDGDELRWAAQP